MGQGIIVFLKILGSLGVFLYGMQLMSESIQKVAGQSLRKTLTAITSTRFKGITTGFVITGLIQSSSATTVMLVSLVSAGLVSLVDSVGVLMGANIGTTVTAWLISLLGYRFSISTLILPLIGLAFPLLFSKRSKLNSWGKVMLGFGLLFIGLDFLKGNIPDFHTHPDGLKFLSQYTNLGWISVVLFVFAGFILTAILQSSSAMIALTLVMSSEGWIPFDLAVAMIIGENIGTTITANIAAAVGNRPSRRTAVIHTLFNVIGAVWALLFFPLIISGLSGILEVLGMNNPQTDAHTVPIALSIFHTAFNILNVLLLVGFSRQLVRISKLLIPYKEDKESASLKYIQSGIVSTSELSLFQVKHEICHLAEHTIRMFHTISEQLYETSDLEFNDRSDRIIRMEEETDKMAMIMIRYLTTLAERDISREGSRRITAHLNIIDNIESVADCIFNINRAFNRKKNLKAWFSPELRENLRDMFQLIDQALKLMQNNLSVHSADVDFTAAEEIEKQINSLRNKLRKEHLKKMEKLKEYRVQAGIIYNDIFSESEKLADYAFNVSESIHDINQTLPE